MAVEKIERKGRLHWVPIAQMRVSPRAQRKYRPAAAQAMANAFDLEVLGYPVVSHRDEWYWIVDGQTRIGAMKIMGWGDQQVQCDTHEGLNEQDEADLFLQLDKRTAIPVFEKYHIAIAAEWETECEIDRVVRAQGLRVSLDLDERSIQAVSALRRVYQAGGSVVLGRDLRVLRDAYNGDNAAFRGPVVQGIGLLCQRHNGKMDDARLVEALGAKPNGVRALMHKASEKRDKNGAPIVHCIAAAATEFYNEKLPRGARLASWWKEDAE